MSPAGLGARNAAMSGLMVVAAALLMDIAAVKVIDDSRLLTPQQER